MKKQTVTTSARLSLFDRCRVDDLPAYGTDNALKTAARDAARADGIGYDRAAAAIIRKHLSKRFRNVSFPLPPAGPDTWIP